MMSINNSSIVPSSNESTSSYTHSNNNEENGPPSSSGSHQHLHPSPTNFKNNIPQSTNHFQIEKQIGVGSFSTVHLVNHVITKQSLTFKMIPTSKIQECNLHSKIQQEITSLMKCKGHVHIITLYDVILLRNDENSKSITLATDYLSGGELHDYINQFLSRGAKLSHATSRRFFQQISSAVRYIHSHPIHVAHRDIKLENILLSNDCKNVKLADFGFSHSICGNSGESDKLNTPCGSPYYAAPELLSKIPYDGTKVDVYSLGVILYVFLCGTFPFLPHNDEDGNEEESMKSMFDKIRKGEYVFPKKNDLQNDEIMLMKGMLHVNSGERMTMEHVCRSSYYLTGLPKYLHKRNQHIVVGHSSVHGNGAGKSPTGDSGDNDRRIVEGDNKGYHHFVDDDICHRVVQLLGRPSSLSEKNEIGFDYSTLTKDEVLQIISHELMDDKSDIFVTNEDTNSIATTSTTTSRMTEEIVKQDVKLVYEMCMEEKRISQREYDISKLKWKQRMIAIICLIIVVLILVCLCLFIVYSV